MSFSILLSLTAKLLPVSTEYAAALLSFRYPSIFPLHPDYVAARSLRSLRRNK